MLFADRVDAGARLAARLEPFRGRDVVVLGLPREACASPRTWPRRSVPPRRHRGPKLGVPFQPELAMGAIGEDGAQGARQAAHRAGVQRGRHRRRRQPRTRDPQRSGVDSCGGDSRGSTCTAGGDRRRRWRRDGRTARVACRVARHLGAARVVLAVRSPLRRRSRASAGGEADEVVYVSAPRSFRAVGAHYLDFAPTTMTRSAALLKAARERRPQQQDIGRRRATSTSSSRPAPDDRGSYLPPERGSRRLRARQRQQPHSPRNRYVAEVLHGRAGHAAARPAHHRGGARPRATSSTSSCSRRGGRGATDWLGAARRTLAPAASAISARAPGRRGAVGGRRAGAIAAVVSRGGRPDLAAERPGERAGADPAHRRRPRRCRHRPQSQAQSLMTGCDTQLVLVEGATHLFEEPGTLAEAASHARNWFVRHLPSPAAYGNNESTLTRREAPALFP